MIKGRYFPPGAAKSVAATLWGEPGRISLQRADESTVQRPVIDRISDSLGGVPRKITFTDGGVFEAPLSADVDGLLAQHGSFFSRLSRLEKNAGVVVAATLAVIGLIVLIHRYGIPLMAAGAAVVTPPAIVTAIDRGTLETVDRAVFEPTRLDAAQQKHLQGLFDELSAVAGGADLRLHFRAGGVIGANALALPGGSIILTDELVKLAESDDEIAGVLAHEIGHVRERHSLKQIYRILGISFMVAIVAGDASQLVDDAVTQASALQTLVYSRGFETDADAYSVGLMVRVGRDPTAFVGLLDRLVADAGGSKETGWLSTHPGTEDRRAAVEEAARHLGWSE